MEFGQLTVSNSRLFFESVIHDGGSCGLQRWRQCRVSWAAVESEEAGKGSASIGGATFAFLEQLRVRILTGEPGRLLSEGYEILHETRFAISHQSSYFT